MSGGQKGGQKGGCCGGGTKKKKEVVTSPGPVTVSNLWEPIPETPGNEFYHVHTWTNKIKTSRYNWWDFIPRNLFEQFWNPANCYFLVMAGLQILPQTTDSDGVPTILGPLGFVIGLTMIKDFVEDLKRHKSDVQENRKKVIVFRDGEEKTTTWMDLKPGEIVKVESKQSFPADLLLLRCSGSLGVAYVETKDLDGETNLKHKHSIPELSKLVPDEDAAKRLFVRATYGGPSERLYEFEGKIEALPKDPTNPDNETPSTRRRRRSSFLSKRRRSSPIKEGEAAEEAEGSKRNRNARGDLEKGEGGLSASQVVEATPGERETPAKRRGTRKSLNAPMEFAASPAQFLLRGSTLVNTDWVFGVVVYTGHKTRVMMNTNTKARYKRSEVLRQYNRHTFALFGLQVGLCLFVATGAVLYLNSSSIQNAWYLMWSADDFGTVLDFVEQYWVIFATQFLLYSNYIPISLFIIMEIVRILQSLFIYTDEEIYSHEVDRPSICQSAGLMEEIGHVTQVFSDKTGTLTQNVMQLRCIGLGDKIHGLEEFEKPATARVVNLGVVEEKSGRVGPDGEGTETWCEEGFGFGRVNPYVMFDTMGFYGCVESQSSEWKEVSKNFLLVLSLCHSVLVRSHQEDEVEEEDGEEDENSPMSPKTPRTPMQHLIRSFSRSPQKSKNPSPKNPQALLPKVDKSNSGLSDKEKEKEKQLAVPLASSQAPNEATVPPTFPSPHLGHDEDPRTPIPQLRKPAASPHRPPEPVAVPPLHPPSSSLSVPPLIAKSDTIPNSPDDSFMDGLVEPESEEARANLAESAAAEELAAEIPTIGDLSRSPSQGDREGDAQGGTSGGQERKKAAVPSVGRERDGSGGGQAAPSGQGTKFTFSRQGTTRTSVFGHREPANLPMASLLPTYFSEEVSEGKPKGEIRVPGYDASSPDELSLVSAAGHLGFEFVGRPDIATIELALTCPAARSLFMETTGRSHSQAAATFHQNGSAVVDNPQEGGVEGAGVFSPAAESVKKGRVGVAFSGADAEHAEAPVSPMPSESVSPGLLETKPVTQTGVVKSVSTKQGEGDGELKPTRSVLKAPSNVSKSAASMGGEGGGGEEIPVFTFELLDVIEFDNDRKRMSVVVRDPNGVLRVLTKGADSAMFKVASARQQCMSVDSLQAQVGQLARKGLRTLVFGFREMEESEFASWHDRYATARGLIGKAKEEAVAACTAELENDLLLVGCTGIEDKLQDGVPQTIQHLKDANIKMWVLTGDKMETAISIAKSCNLITEGTYNAVVHGDTRKDIRNQLQTYRDFCAAAELLSQQELFLDFDEAAGDEFSVSQAPSADDADGSLVAAQPGEKSTPARDRGTSFAVSAVEGGDRQRFSAGASQRFSAGSVPPEEPARVPPASTSPGGAGVRQQVNLSASAVDPLRPMAARSPLSVKHRSASAFASSGTGLHERDEGEGPVWIPASALMKAINENIRVSQQHREGRERDRERRGGEEEESDEDGEEGGDFSAPRTTRAGDKTARSATSRFLQGDQTGKRRSFLSTFNRKSTVGREMGPGLSAHGPAGVPLQTQGTAHEVDRVNSALADSELLERLAAVFHEEREEGGPEDLPGDVLSAIQEIPGDSRSAFGTPKVPTSISDGGIQRGPSSSLMPSRISSKGKRPASPVVGPEGDIPVQPQTAVAMPASDVALPSPVIEASSVPEAHDQQGGGGRSTHSSPEKSEGARGHPPKLSFEGPGPTSPEVGEGAGAVSGSKRGDTPMTPHRVFPGYSGGTPAASAGLGPQGAVRAYTDLAITISGDALNVVLRHKATRVEFFRLAQHCSTVIACRATPKQKASLVSQSCGFQKGTVSLSIGDGANDVPMIREAHVGVGIAGKEGLQAVRASDFAIGQFRFLQKILFVHGRESLRRNSLLLYMTMSRNITYAMVNFFYTGFTSMSGFDFFDPWLKQLWNLNLTPVGSFVWAIFDREVPHSIMQICPFLYPTIRGKERVSQFLGWNHFWWWYAFGVWGGAVACYVPLWTLDPRHSVYASGLQVPSVYFLGLVTLFLAVWIANGILVPFVNTWFWFIHLAIWCAPLFFWASAVICVSIDLSPNLEGEVERLGITPVVFPLLVIGSLIAFLPLFAWKWGKILWTPGPVQIIKERLFMRVFDVVIAPKGSGKRLAVVVPRWVEQPDTGAYFANAEGFEGGAGDETGAGGDPQTDGRLTTALRRQQTRRQKQTMSSPQGNTREGGSKRASEGRG
eukprot:Cvel_10153.t1-p1 / transcript=Cvel_10153.t1 / gene=Cvel_10153 / organism=Chromera_velia_CCMP2878 / gene_product=Phospholipid-transporting ATPase DNF2, putative / transcript_product=Phospholipid-transporting ATPase DNF2, putative / location=Cvel_scaffold605:62087-77229(+) / protein_length=2225 / sequence_SO=supercontig / SO=protein_coding / is_pseudo=false